MRLIDADALIKMMVAENNRCPGTSWEISDIERYVTELLPTINPDDLRPHGWWVFQYWDSEYINKHYSCSECGFESCVKDSYSHTNYCSNCGAKMDGKENGDE